MGLRRAFLTGFCGAEARDLQAPRPFVARGRAQARPLVAAQPASRGPALISIGVYHLPFSSGGNRPTRWMARSTA